MTMATGELQIIPLNQLHEATLNPRKHFDPKKIEELASSVRKVGILQPLTVRPNKDGFEIGTGHRRYRAAKLAKLEAVPAIVREMNDEEFLELLHFENLLREDVHPLDEADGFRDLLAMKDPKTGERKWTVERIAERLGHEGKSISYVYQRLKLVDLIMGAREAFFKEEITAGHAILIARLQSEDQAEAMKAVFNDGYGFAQRGAKRTARSVRDLTRWIDENVHLDLHSAPWKKDDATLVPEAGPCTTCPKRTGNSPQLFPDIAKKDTCTDAGCFKAKMAAFLARQRNELVAKGEKVVELSTAWSDGARKKDGRLTKSMWEPARKGSCPYVQTGIVSDMDHEEEKRGRILTVCAEPKCKKHHGSAGTAGRESPQELGARKRRDAEHRRRVAGRKAVLDAVLAKVPAILARADLELIAIKFFGDIWSEYRKRLCVLHGWEIKKKIGGHGVDYDKIAAAETPKLSGPDLSRFLVSLALIRDADVNIFRDHRPGALLATAKRYGVNIAAVERAAQAEPLKKKPVQTSTKAGEPTWKKRSDAAARGYTKRLSPGRTIKGKK